MIVLYPAAPALQPQPDHSCRTRAVTGVSWPCAFADGHAVVSLLGGTVRRPNATLKYWSLHL